MNRKKLRIATRQSPLALWQANHVRGLLLKNWPKLDIELVPLVTTGDKFLKDKLSVVGGKGLFVKELEEALLTDRADIAVHSTKDMPAELPQGLFIAAICTRDNPFDAFISSNYSSLSSLPFQAIVGTSSLRRQSQLLAFRPDLQIKTLRGNIQTRLDKLKNGEYQAIILAAAGLERMALGQSITELLSEDIMLPACGQGALCIECKEDDTEIQELIRCLDDPISSLCVSTERLVNFELGGNCHVPLAVYCNVTAEKQLILKAKIANLNGTTIIEDTQLGAINDAITVAQQCTQSLLAKDAKALLDSIPL